MMNLYVLAEFPIVVEIAIIKRVFAKVFKLEEVSEIIEILENEGLISISGKVVAITEKGNLSWDSKNFLAETGELMNKE